MDKRQSRERKALERKIDELSTEVDELSIEVDRLTEARLRDGASLAVFSAESNYWMAKFFDERRKLKAAIARVPF